jgi:hypothetical protein
MSLINYIAENLSNFVNEDGTVLMYHFAKIDQPSIVLNPDMFGSNSWTRGDIRVSDMPRVFFYLNLDDKERFFLSHTLYTTKVKVTDLYDIVADPLKIKAKLREENNGVLNVDMLLRNAKERGFKGVYYKPYMDVVNWFYPITVEKTEQPT